MELVTRERAEELVIKLGVKFCPHARSTKMAIMSMYAKLFGPKDWSRRFWVTIGRTIYHPDNIFNPFEYYVRVLHELVHVEQQARESLFWWTFKYLTSQSFRWKAERKAYLVDMHYDMQRKIPPYIISTTLAAKLRCDYGIRCVSEKDMSKWFEENC